MINYYEYLRPKISGIAIIASKRGKRKLFNKKNNKREVVAFINAISLFCYKGGLIYGKNKRKFI